jgi:nicotinate phosphoribosyltransferase
MAEQGKKLVGVRIDSGDLAAQARAVRKVFDDANLREVKIFGSGGLDEFDLAQFAAANIPYDSYGVGTKMGTSADAPWSDISYKLVEFENRSVLKLSEGKVSWPGKKQVFRSCDGQGRMQHDVIGLREESLTGEGLLKEYMRDGRACESCPILTESRKIFEVEFASLPENVKAIRNPDRYPVEFSPALTALRHEITQKIARS